MTDKTLHVVVGLGKTGLSLVRFLRSKGLAVAAVDTRLQPPELESIKTQFPDLPIRLGSLDSEFMQQAHTLYVSPGLDLQMPPIQEAIARGVKVSGDVDLFLRYAKAPVVTITGSNAKSTVTSLVGQMAIDSGLKTGVGGNLGTPALDLLADDIEIYVLEVSSFQLETISHTGVSVASCLNISPDHMDRYRDLAHYTEIKLRVYEKAKTAVVNRGDVATYPQSSPLQAQVSFGLDEPERDQFGLRTVNDLQYLALGEKLLLPVDALRLRGTHNYSNVLAALAIGQAAGLTMASMLKTAQSFPGLAHRCQWVAEKQGVHWFNDSKATNVGATLAALNGLAEEESKLVLIAGGDGKGADFSGLTEAVAKHCRAVVLLGQDAPLLAQTLADTGVIIETVESMQEAVNMASKRVVRGDSVLLAPACASWDMFKNFEERGDIFIRAVEALS